MCLSVRCIENWTNDCIESLLPEFPKLNENQKHQRNLLTIDCDMNDFELWIISWTDSCSEHKCSIENVEEIRLQICLQMKKKTIKTVCRLIVFSPDEMIKFQNDVQCWVLLVLRNPYNLWYRVHCTLYNKYRYITLIGIWWPSGHWLP